MNVVLFQIAAGSRTSLLDNQRQIATVPQERIEIIISSQFMAHCDDKEEIWARVKVSNKCSTATCLITLTVSVVKIEMSAQSVSKCCLRCKVYAKHCSFILFMAHFCGIIITDGDMY